MKKFKWALVLCGLTLSVTAITKTGRIQPKKRLTSCVLEDLATAGIGDVKYSILSETQFQSVNGTGWVLMKAQSKSDLGIGTTEASVFDYLTTTDNTSVNFLPDGRGLFLRGKNNGRADGAQNPDGEKLLGAYQADELKSHTHGFSTYVVSYSSSGTVYVGSGNQGQSGATGGNETRAKNVTVNTYIKVKRNCLDAIATSLIGANTTSIADLQAYNAKNICDSCINLPENDLNGLRTKLACFSNEIDLYEADQKQWSVTCTARTVGYAKRVLMLIGSSRTADDNAWLSHLDNQYPYYNVVTVN